MARKPVTGPGTPSSRQSHLFEQVTRVLQALAQRSPLLLMVDDLQWADLGSISLLFHLGRRLEGSRILIVGIYRPADVAMGRPATGTNASPGQMERHPLEPVVNELQRHFGQIQVSLGQSEDRQFVESFLDTEPNRLDARFREALYQQTRGHAMSNLRTVPRSTARPPRGRR